MTKILNVKINAPGKRTLSMQIKTLETVINLGNQQNESMLATFIVSRLSLYMQVTRLHHMQDLQISPPESREGVNFSARSQKWENPGSQKDCITGDQQDTCWLKNTVQGESSL